MTADLQLVESNTSPDVEAELRSLVHRFRDVLALRPHVLKCFAEQGVQVEGWLKGEFLAFLTDEKRSARIGNFDREFLIGVGKRKADICLSIQSGMELLRIWIELKHFLIGLQKGIAYDAYGYFNDPLNGIKSDVDKLLGVPSSHRYLLLLATAKPNAAEWAAAVNRFNTKFQPCLRSLTDPGDFPDEFFLGLVSVALHPSG